jgi:hypothetical protein
MQRLKNNEDELTCNTEQDFSEKSVDFSQTDHVVKNDQDLHTVGHYECTTHFRKNRINSLK